MSIPEEPRCQTITGFDLPTCSLREDVLDVRNLGQHFSHNEDVLEEQLETEDYTERVKSGNKTVCSEVQVYTHTEQTQFTDGSTRDNDIYRFTRPEKAVKQKCNTRW